MSTRPPAASRRKSRPGSSASGRKVDEGADAASAEAEVRSFIAKFAPATAGLIRAARAKLRLRFPAANELVYDNYNFFVIGYSPTERPSDTIVSLAANAKGLGLSFYCGATLADPHGFLEGGGVQNRFIRLAHASFLDAPGVAALIDAAEAQSQVPMPEGRRGRTIIRSISARQRPRR